MDSLIPELTGFRTHFLVPHTVVGAITPAKPLFNGLNTKGIGLYSTIYLYDGKPIFKVKDTPQKPEKYVTLQALTDIYIQEPGYTFAFDGFDGRSIIWGYNSQKKKAVGDPYYMVNKNAHKSTVHFSRYKLSPNYVDSVLIKRPFKSTILRCDGGFTKGLKGDAIGSDWIGCSVFGNDYVLEGTTKGFEMIKRWECAGYPIDQAWMHFLGWTGGAAAVTNEHGQDIGAPGDKYLWQPRSWKLLEKGHRISQRHWLEGVK